MSRMLRKPLSLMKEKVDLALGFDETNQTKKNLKFMIYSAHDTQIVNMMVFLQKDFKWAPYASTVTFELKYSAKCVKENASADCFGISVVFNGTPQLLDGCTGDGFTLEGCSYNQFVKYVNDRWYSGPSSDDLDAACATQV